MRAPERSPRGGAVGLAKAILARLRALREAAGISQQQLEERLLLGPGWIERFETGKTIPGLELLLLIVQTIGARPDQLFADLGIADSPAEVEQRCIFARERDTSLDIHFVYAEHDAVYTLDNASEQQFASIVKTMRDGLARLASDVPNEKALKADAVARSFLAAAAAWPHANPSDLWWFVIYRLYCDPFNHPARFARLDFNQSWKRTGGWGLEQVLVRFYGDFLRSAGIILSIGQRKDELVRQFHVDGRLEADKVDVVLSSNRLGDEIVFGVVHVKSSFAERRTDDVPLSQMLMRAGYVSPLWTMDCKSMPAKRPVNKGELGTALATPDRRSAKRKDIEDDGSFSACFSYNRNTVPTPAAQQARARVIVCDFSSPDDAFSQFVIAAWERFHDQRLRRP